MDNPRVGLVVLGIYAILLIVGGVIGFLKARSLPSLVAGVVSGVLALGCLALSATKNEAIGYTLALILAIVLFLFFAYRGLKTGKMMPGGMLAVVSLLVIGVMLWSIPPAGR